MTKKMEKIYCAVCGKYRKILKRQSIVHFGKKFFLLFEVGAKLKIKKYLNKENQLRY